MRYHKVPVRFLCDDPYWALFSSYVNGDGDLATNSRVRFYDEERATLMAIRGFFFEKFGYLFPRPIYQRNQYGRGQWVICTRHAAVHFVLTKYFGIPNGRKKLTSTISKTIVQSKNLEVKYAALAGMLSSDGYVSGLKSQGRYSIKIGVLSTVSRAKAETVDQLLGALGYHPYVSTSTFANPFNGRLTTAFGIVVHRHNEVADLLFRLFPYLVKPNRSQRWIKLIAAKSFFSRVRLRSVNTHTLLRRAAMKSASSSYRYLHVLVDLARKWGLRVDRWGGVKHWTNSRRMSLVPLPIIVECCRIVGDDPFKYVPPGFACLLWLHGVISYRDLLALRGVEPVLNIERFVSRHRVKRKTELRPALPVYRQRALETSLVLDGNALA